MCSRSSETGLDSGSILGTTDIFALESERQREVKGDTECFVCWFVFVLFEYLDTKRSC